jgi:hypothetical protein
MMPTSFWSPILLALSQSFACDAPDPAALASNITPTSTPAAAVAEAKPSKGGGAQVKVTIGDAPQRVEPVATSDESNGLVVSVHRYVHPPRTGDDKQDYWTQLQVWGEITNTSKHTFENVTARIVYFDAAGGIVGTESIASLSQQDAGDHAPGETVLGGVGFVAPGQSVPFHAMRNLAAIKGEVASFAVYPRRGMPADPAAPKGVAVDVKDVIEAGQYDETRIISGSVRNDGEGGCRDPYFVVALLDDAGRVADVESFIVSNDTQQVLGKGESLPFRGKIYLYGENAWKKAAKVRTYVDCKAVY